MQQERSLFVLWGPSRVSIGRHLPRILSLDFCKQKKWVFRCTVSSDFLIFLYNEPRLNNVSFWFSFLKSYRYEVVIRADSGQEIDEPLVDEIIAFISNHYPRKQVHLIILRDSVFSSRIYTYLPFGPGLSYLEKRTRDIPNCHLILSRL